MLMCSCQDRLTQDLKDSRTSCHAHTEQTLLSLTAERAACSHNATLLERKKANKARNASQILHEALDTTLQMLLVLTPKRGCGGGAPCRAVARNMRRIPDPYLNL